MWKKSGQTLLESGRVQLVRLDRIRPNPAQPRRIFDPAGLQELAESIRQYGVLQPLTVRKLPDGVELVAGERRLRAARLAGLREVPCIFVSVDQVQSGMLALVENLQRRDLDYIEEAEGLARLIHLYGLSQEQAAARVGKSQSAVANKLRLLQHGDAVLDALREGKLTERHGRALLKLKQEPDKLSAIAQICRQGMSVAQTEKYIQQLLKGKEDAPQRANVGVFLNNLSASLSRMQQSGIPAVSERRETESQIVLTITIPKELPGGTK